MLTVGCPAIRLSASRNGTSRTQRCTPNCFFSTSSRSFFAARSTISCSAGESGRTRSNHPSIAGSTPSGVTSVASACTRWKTGLSTAARIEEWMSFAGPRPHFSPLAESSHSITPFAPRWIVT